MRNTQRLPETPPGETVAKPSRWDIGPALAELEFPGCVATHMTLDDLVDYDGRIEFWDAEVETAWICQDGSATHEAPAHFLPELVAWIGSVRGEPIRCYGSTTIVLNDPGGRRLRAMEPDQCVYLNLSRSNIPGASVLVAGEYDYPDVVLEVDNTTDVYRGKLSLYEAWGLPELWVEVPEIASPSRPRRLRPGLAIHLLEDGAYRESPESRVFPGWTTEEIHAALNETSASARSLGVLRRVGELMAARRGTTPANHPILRWQRHEGRVEGRVEGRLAGRLEGQEMIVRRVLQSRGMEISAGFPSDLPDFRDGPEELIVAAALACDSEADFAARIRGKSPPGNGPADTQ